MYGRLEEARVGPEVPVLPVPVGPVEGEVALAYGPVDEGPLLPVPVLPPVPVTMGPTVSELLGAGGREYPYGG